MHTNTHTLSIKITGATPNIRALLAETVMQQLALAEVITDVKQQLIADGTIWVQVHADKVEQWAKQLEMPE